MRQVSTFKRCASLLLILYNNASTTAAATEEKMTEAVSTLWKRTIPALERMTKRKPTQKSATVADLHFNEAPSSGRGIYDS